MIGIFYQHSLDFVIKCFFAVFVEVNSDEVSDVSDGSLDAGLSQYQMIFEVSFDMLVRQPLLSIILLE